VELALLLPLLALLLLGAVDLGRAFFAYTRLTHAVEQGALYGLRGAWAVAPDACTPTPQFGPCADPENIKYRVRNAGALGLTNADIAVRCYQGRTDTPVVYTPPGGAPLAGDCRGATAGDSLEVTARSTFRPLTGQLASLLPGGYQLRKSVRMVLL
jgi:hypothetical protein